MLYLPFDLLNSFVESTCVIVVFAYLLTRNPLIALISQEKSSLRQALTLGAVLGVAGLVELYFVRNRFPYDTYALIITFAALRGGWPVGLVTAGVVGLGAASFLYSVPLGRTLVFILVALCAGVGARSLMTRLTARAGLPWLICSSLVAVMLADVGAITIREFITEPNQTNFSLSVALLRFFADGLGIILLQLILNDAQVRLASERFAIEAAHARTLLVEAKLVALRARIHPHFLFNALTTIAALCRLDAEKAEAATVQLAQIMRRTLEMDKRIIQPVGYEIEHVTDYVAIEKLRLGTRLRFDWQVDPESASALVPAFVLQTLVENAIQHGIAPKIEPGHVEVIIRKRDRYILVAVRDDGVGIPPRERERLRHLRCAGEEAHGMVLANEQLVLLHGTVGRLRVFSREDVGTLVAFRLPVSLAVIPPGTASAGKTPDVNPPLREDKTADGSEEAKYEKSVRVGRG